MAMATGGKGEEDELIRKCLVLQMRAFSTSLGFSRSTDKH